jgi:hypothetical protein
MKAMIITLAVLISAVNMKSCNKNKEKSAKPDLKPILIDESMEIAPKYDNTVKFTARIKGDILTATIEYYGCKDDEFDLVFNKMWLKSLPPKANLFLKKTNGKCSTQGNYTKTYKFDLKNLRNSSSNEIKVKVMNYTEYFKYKYEQ